MLGSRFSTALEVTALEVTLLEVTALEVTALEVTVLEVTTLASRFSAALEVTYCFTLFTKTRHVERSRDTRHTLSIKLLLFIWVVFIMT